LLGAVAVTPSGLALDPHRLPSQYIHRRWQVEQGLPQDGVQAIAQTPDGYLWLGTQVGLARFDGLRFTVFDSESAPEIADNWIASLLVRRSGALWIGTSDGIVVYADGRFGRLVAENPPRGTVEVMVEDERGTVWIGMNGGGVAYFDGRRFVPLRADLSSVEVYSLAVSAEEVWVGTAKGLERVRGGAVEHYGQEIGGEAVYALARSPDGRLLVGTNRGVFAFDGTHMAPAHADFAEDEVLAVRPDRDGNVWVGTRAGLKRWRAGRVTLVAAHDGRSDNHVVTLFEDRQGTLWVGTQGNGLEQVRDGPFVAFGRAEGLSHDIAWSIGEDDDGVVWVGSEGGLDRFEGGRWTNVALPVGSRSSVFSVLAERRSDVWIGTNGFGLIHLSDGRATSYTEASGVALDAVMALFRDRRGVLWIGTTGDLFRLENGRLTLFGTPRGLPSEMVDAIHEDRHGRIWVGTVSHAFVLDGNRFVRRLQQTMLPPGQVWDIVEDAAGDLWFACHDGLYRLRGRELFRFTSLHGLPAGDFGSMVERPRGVFWVSTAKGIFRVLRRDLEAVARGSASRVGVTLLGVADGMRKAEGSYGQSPTSFVARDGRIWFPTTGGVAVLDPLARRPPQFQAIVEGAVVDSRFHPGRRDLVLGPRTEKLELHYTVPAFAAPERIRFRYRLAGFDRAWVEAGTRRVAYYPHLPPGRYRFQVEAVDSGDRWVPARAPMTVELKPPFQRTAWFLSLCAAAVISLVWLLHTYRMRQLGLRHRAVLDERARIARELHDTVAQDLTGLALQLDTVLPVLPADAEEARTQILQAKQTAVRGLSEARRALFQLRSHARDADLPAALRRSAADMTAGSPVRAEVRIAGPVRRLREGIEPELLRIAQEAMANALRHAAATRIDVLLDLTPPMVRLSVTDDGRGSGPIHRDDLTAMHYGVVGMRERARLIGGRFVARSDPGKGTQITVEVRA
jgi:ligand-binding sensor domain-containing protein/signal transduction histidine kinase